MMQLNKFTDYALRLVMYISRPNAVSYTIADIAYDLQISQNHLVKIVHFLGKEGVIETSRGKGGGVRLNRNAMTLALGDLVRLLQGNSSVVDCHKPACVLRFGCELKPILDQALNSFYEHLNQYTIGDIVVKMNSRLYGDKPTSHNFAQAIATLNIEAER